MIKPEPPRMEWFAQLGLAVGKWIYNMWNWVVHTRVVTVTNGAPITLGAGAVGTSSYTEPSLTADDVVVGMVKSTAGNLHIIGATSSAGSVQFTLYHPGAGTETAPSSIDCLVMRK